MRIRVNIKLLLLGLAVAALTHAQLAPPSSASGWNRLTMSGYGEKTGAPLCHALSYFKASPQRLDVDIFLRQQKTRELNDEVTLNLLGTVKGHRIYELVHMVQSPEWKRSRPELFLQIRLLLMERAPDEFCDLYEYEHLDAAMFFDDMHEARLLTIKGRRVLKSIIQDMKTYAVAYWAVDGKEPILLSTQPIIAAIRGAAPKGSRWSE
jgi:hypothetical protein